jgi:hypothetical protein
MPSMPSRHIVGWSALLLLPGLLATLSSPASALQSEGSGTDAEVALAEKKAAQAFEAYQGKRFAEAVALYIDAYQAAPNADILFNIARIYDAKLGDRPLAISFYRRYIADPGAVADRIQVANERLVALREAELAATRPSAAPEGALAAGPAGARLSGSSSPPEGDWSGAEVTGVIMGITGVVALGVGAGFGIAAVRETKTMRDLCDGTVCREQRGIDAAESATSHATISTIGFASGGALLALGAAFYFWLGADSSERPNEASDRRLWLNAGAGSSQSPFALELGGSW